MCCQERGRWAAGCSSQLIALEGWGLATLGDEQGQDKGSSHRLQQGKVSLDLERDFTMEVNGRRGAQIGCGIAVLRDAQSSAGYGSKQHDPVGPGLTLHLLKCLLCCQRGE